MKTQEKACRSKESIFFSAGGFLVPEDARSHISQMSTRGGPKGRSTSIADLTGKPPAYPGIGSAAALGLAHSRPGKTSSFSDCQIYHYDLSHHSDEWHGGSVSPSTSPEQSPHLSLLLRPCAVTAERRHLIDSSSPSKHNRLSIQSNSSSLSSSKRRRKLEAAATNHNDPYAF